MARLAVAAIAAVSLAACVGVVDPDRSPDVLPRTPASGGDSTPGAAFALDSVPAGRLRGVVLAPSRDSTVAWTALAGARVEAATRDPQSGAMAIVATTTANAFGQFAFGPLDTPTGLLFVRATPAAGTAYRATRWLAAYAFVGRWGVATLGARAWSLGPYLVVERADAPTTDRAPILLVGHVVGADGDVGIAGARVVIERVAMEGGAGATPQRIGASLGVAASARTDADGFFAVQLPRSDTYATRITMPAGSTYADVPLSGGPSGATASAEVTTLNYAQFIVTRR